MVTWNRCRFLMVGAAVVLFSVTTARAAIIVGAGDVAAGTYTYEIGYANYTQAVSDAESKTNFYAGTWGSDTRYTFAQNGQSFAQLVLHWDFSGSGLSPKSVDLADRTTLFTNTSTERARAVVDYSIDGAIWHTIDVQFTPDYPANSTSVVNDDWTNVALDLGPGVDDFYYRLTMATWAGDADGKFTNWENQ